MVRYRSSFSIRFMVSIRSLITLSVTGKLVDLLNGGFVNSQTSQVMDIVASYYMLLKITKF